MNTEKAPAMAIVQWPTDLTYPPLECYTVSCLVKLSPMAMNAFHWSLINELSLRSALSMARSLARAERPLATAGRASPARAPGSRRRQFGGGLQLPRQPCHRRRLSPYQPAACRSVFPRVVSDCRSAVSGSAVRKPWHGREVLRTIWSRAAGAATTERLPGRHGAADASKPARRNH